MTIKERTEVIRLVILPILGRQLEALSDEDLLKYRDHALNQFKDFTEADRDHYNRAGHGRAA